MEQMFQRFINKSNITFKQHQYDGVAWCVENENTIGPQCYVGGNMVAIPPSGGSSYDVKKHIGGGFIADEMGLGKTITMIANIICQFRSHRNTLIVLPPALIPQWTAEINRTTGHSPLLFYGSQNKKTITIDELKNAPIVITSYASIMIPLKHVIDNSKDTLLHQMKWDRIIFDEGHHLRNKNSRYYGAKKLVSRIKWIISGTPVQNYSTDFKNLCSIVGLPPNLLNNNEYNKENRDRLFNHYILKRSKTDVGLNLLPVNLENKHIVWNTTEERQLSEDIHRAIGMCDKSDRLKMYQHARQTCILPEIIRDTPLLPYMRHAGYIPHDRTRDFYNVGLSSSTKMDHVVRDILAREGNGNRKIVFCHFRKEIDTLMSRLNEMGMTNIVSIDGRITSQNQRKRIMEANYEVLILQIQTGCEGLNLQQYNEVYFISPNWNPMMEQQAIARCHRIGQTKEVFVFRYGMDKVFEGLDEDDKPSELISMDTRIVNRQQIKISMASDILEPPEVSRSFHTILSQ
jgi:SNF2 family DNA or RNA helicase